MSSSNHSARLKLIASMVIFGTIGLFVRAVHMPASLIAMTRGYIGFLCLLPVLWLRRRKQYPAFTRKQLFLLILSGALIGFNWILLFEAYRFTTVAVATLCYYMQPVILTAAGVVLLKEKITGRKTVCVLVALLGMTFVSGVWQGGAGEAHNLKGILLRQGAACLYAGVMLLNLIMGQMEPLRKTCVQLFSAAVAVTPYVLLTVRLADIVLTPQSLVLLLVVCLIHTGFAYLLYFDGLQYLPAQTAAILSYIDPVVAVLLSALLLREPLGVSGVVGAFLILGAALVSEL